MLALRSQVDRHVGEGSAGWRGGQPLICEANTGGGQRQTPGVAMSELRSREEVRLEVHMTRARGRNCATLCATLHLQETKDMRGDVCGRLDGVRCEKKGDLAHTLGLGVRYGGLNLGSQSMTNGSALREGSTAVSGYKAQRACVKVAHLLMHSHAP
jgi:hypothetical protein